ncbi:MAG: hypothetical protein KatS3mg014_2037 [Actinomycetota bacterium]|nr:MAG: hypothetical protein KatS3mg014_2037 [Actinomycetota bacterium]
MGFLGQLIPRKGVDVLLAAVARALASGTPVEVTIVGDGPERRALEELSRSLGIDDRIRFVGAVRYEEVGRYLREMDVLVLPTRYDYRAMVVLEALAAGIPVITTTADGNSTSTVVDGENGFVVPPDDPDALAQRLALLATDPTALGRVRQGASGTRIPTPAEAAEALVSLLGIGPRPVVSGGGERPR